MHRLVPAVAALVLAVGLIATANGGEFNKAINIGDACPDFKSLEGVDGKSCSLSDYKDKEVLVLVITCNHCPVAQAYEDRIIALAKKHAGPDSKVAVVAICVNNIPEDLLPKMKERARAKNFNFPYLHDSSQKIARALGASRTPEFFVFDKNRKLVYMGALDDNQDAGKAKVNYVEKAIEAALQGKLPEKKETAARGCSIKFD
jgi:peroxiredoxin